VRVENEVIDGHPDEPKDANTDECWDGCIQHLDVLSDAVTERRGKILQEPLDSFSCHNKILTPGSFLEDDEDRR